MDERHDDFPCAGPYNPSDSQSLSLSPGVWSPSTDTPSPQVAWERFAASRRRGQANTGPRTSAGSRFCRSNLNALAHLFTQSPHLARKLGMVKMGRVAPDGTKLEANAFAPRCGSRSTADSPGLPCRQRGRGRIPARPDSGTAGLRAGGSVSRLLRAGPQAGGHGSPSAHRSRRICRTRFSAARWSSHVFFLGARPVADTCASCAG